MLQIGVTREVCCLGKWKSSLVPLPNNYVNNLKTIMLLGCKHVVAWGSVGLSHRWCWDSGPTAGLQGQRLVEPWGLYLTGLAGLGATLLANCSCVTPQSWAKPLPPISFTCASSKVDLEWSKLLLHRVWTSSGTLWSCSPRDFCFSWWLPPSRRLGATEDRWAALVIVDGSDQDHEGSLCLFPVENLRKTTLVESWLGGVLLWVVLGAPGSAGLAFESNWRGNH